jgi:hypothetical protein
MIERTAHITDELPKGGHYRYKTDPNMTGQWMISGEMKVNRVLTDDEVTEINNAAGVADLAILPKLACAKMHRLASAILQRLPRLRWRRTSTAQSSSDLPPEAPSFITRVCGFGFHIRRFRFEQTR